MLSTRQTRLDASVSSSATYSALRRSQSTADAMADARGGGTRRRSASGSASEAGPLSMAAGMLGATGVTVLTRGAADDWGTMAA